MSIDRRQLLAAAAALLAARGNSTRAQSRRPRIRAVAFDGLAVFDAGRTLALAEAAFPGRGSQLVDAWRGRQLDYQWLRAAGERYADFMEVTRDSLDFAARALRLELRTDLRAALLDVYLTLDAWPDAKVALRALQESGSRLALLSNMTPRMLSSGIDRAGLGGLFDLVLSTHEVMSFKPARPAYALATSALELSSEAILFVASAGWDAAAAKWFGYPTFWVNRNGTAEEALDATPDGIGRDLSDVVAFIRGHEESTGDE